MRITSLLLAISFTLHTFAGAGVFPQGDFIKMIKDGLKFKGNQTFEVNSDNVIVANQLKADGSRLRDINGEVNYIQNSTLFNSDAGYIEYDDGSSAIPVDGTGSTAANLTGSRNVITPLRNGADYSIVKGAADAQGEGVSYDFTIDNADQARNLTISFDYDLSDSGYADDDMGVYVYDVTNSQLIRANGEDIKGGKGKHYAQFQTAPDSTSYRLIFHVQSTNTTGYTGYFDNIAVSPTRLARGTIATDWKEFTPSGAASKSNATLSNAKYRRVGSDINIIVKYNSTAGYGSSLDSDEYLPSGLSVDESVLVGNQTDERGRVGVGHWHFADIGSNAYTGSLEYREDTDQIVIRSGIGDSLPTAGSDTFTYSIKLPIQGWSSNAQMSEDLGGREIVAKGAGNGGTTISANETNIDWNETEDTTSSFDGTTFTAPETGNYLVTGAVLFSSVNSGSIRSYINGTGSKYVGATTASTTGKELAAIIKLTKNDELNFRSDTDGTLSNSTTVHRLEITKLASSQTILDDSAIICQTKYPTGDITSDADGNIDELDFANLEIGKKYEVLVNMKYDVTAATAFSFGMQQGGSNLAVMVERIGDSVTTSKVAHKQKTVQFTATATSIEGFANNIGTGRTILADGTSDETFVRLCQLPNTTVINSTKFD